MSAPMPSIPPIVTIDATGITAPPFQEVLSYLQAQYRMIYGQDIDIDPDTQDGQWIGVVSDCLNTMNNSAVAAFLSFIPSFAQGAGLSALVGINGITRHIASASQVVLTLGGTAGKTITNATVADNLNLNTQWFIANTVTIPPEGTVDVLAICLSPGAVQAAPGTLTQIVTPTPGWQTVTNNAAATPGAPVETDAQLRRRQTKSTANPAETILESIQGNLLQLPGVTRAKVFQNDTLQTDANGIPPRSIACVVAGGDPTAIAATIAGIKAPGVPTYGNTSVTVYDQKGTPNHINYWILSEIEVQSYITLTAAVGYSDTIGQYIQAAVAEYYNTLEIGSGVLLGDVYSPANLDGDAAITATGLLQASLDPLGATYSIDAPYGLAIARLPQMTADANGPYVAGATEIGVVYGPYYSVGERIFITLDDTDVVPTTVLGIAGNVLTIADPIPSGRSVVAGAVIFGVGNLTIFFNEAASAVAATDVILNPH